MRLDKGENLYLAIRFHTSYFQHYWASRVQCSFSYRALHFKLLLVSCASSSMLKIKPLLMILPTHSPCYYYLYCHNTCHLVKICNSWFLFCAHPNICFRSLSSSPAFCLARFVVNIQVMNLYFRENHLTINDYTASQGYLKAQV